MTKAAIVKLIKVSEPLPLESIEWEAPIEIQIPEFQAL